MEQEEVAVAGMEQEEVAVAAVEQEVAAVAHAALLSHHRIPRGNECHRVPRPPVCIGCSYLGRATLYNECKLSSGGSNQGSQKQTLVACAEGGHSQTCYADVAVCTDMEVGDGAAMAVRETEAAEV